MIGAASFAAIGRATCPHAATNLRLGVLADTHLRLPPGGIAWTKKLESVLRRMDKEKVEAVLIAGDLTDFGLIPELKVFADTWYKVFPGDRRSDGGHVEKLFIYGDHDTQGIHVRIDKIRGYPEDKDEIAKLAICNNDRAAIWKEMFHEDWAPVMKKTLKGYDFILTHHAHGEADNKWGQRAPAMAPFYETYRPDPSRPFFHVQHRVCKDTAYVPGHGVNEGGIGHFDSGESTQILSRFPNCFALCGHAHKGFQSEKSIWQGDFTCMVVPSLAYATISRFGHEKGYLTKEQKEAGYVPQMDGFAGSLAWSTQQGMIADIYDDRIALHRIDFESPEPGLWGPDWVVPLPLGKEKPFAFDVREKTLPVPKFPKGAKMSVSAGVGKNRKKEDVEQVTVSFPTVLSSNGGTRAYDYEVVAVGVGAGGEKVVKRVLSPRFWRAECAEPPESNCVFAKSELPKGKVQFAVRPANSFGKAGGAIGCNWKD